MTSARGWPRWPLSEMVDVLDSKRIPVKAAERANRAGDVPYYGAVGQVGWIDKALFNEPLLLLGEDGVQFFDPGKPKAYLVQGPAWVNNHAHVLRVRPEVERQYLAYFLNHFDYRGYANGTTRLKLTQAAMRRIPVVLAPQDEQRRIVDILEDHLSRLDAADDYLTATTRRVQAWSRAWVRREIWATSAPRRPVGELLSEPMRNGHSARAVRDGEPGVRTLTLTAVTRGEFTDRFTKITSADPERIKGLWLEPGDVLVQRANTPELVGTTALYEGQNDWAIFPDLLIRLRADEAIVRSGFLASALASEDGHRQLRSKAKGLAGSMPKIDQGAIASTTLPIPALSEQSRIMGRLSDAADRRQHLLAAVAQSKRRVYALRRSLLEAAFSGRLTGTGTDLESVEEMAQA